MKKIILLLFTFTLFSISSINVNALQTNETDQAIRAEKLLEQGSVELVELYNEQNFIMGSEWFDEYGNLLPSSLLDVKYIETTTFVSSIDRRLDTKMEKYLTAEEYKNWESSQITATCSSGAADCWETTAKRLSIIYQTYPTERVMVINQWKTMPSVRSFDTIGLLYNNFNMTSAWGYQWYNTSSNTDPQTVDYGYGGTNMKISVTDQKGISISQNIIDDTYNVLQNDLYVSGTQGQYMQMAASYQHAVTNIDLATSMNFNFYAWGMGRVFNWNTSWSNWDNMQGVCFNWSPYLWTC
jgi:hypothetical protein